MAWSNVKELYDHAKKLPIVSYEKQHHEIQTVIDISQVPDSPISMHETTPFFSQDTVIDVSGIESNSSSSSLINGDTNVSNVKTDAVEEAWHVSRLRLHRAVYKWPGVHVDINNVCKTEYERKWVYDNLIVIKRQINKQQENADKDERLKPGFSTCS
jgi:hypothetical protein